MISATGRRRALLVLGMHRSGTSAAARVVNLLGANLGDQLVEPAPDNPDGFWEHADAVRIDEALLEGLGRTWYDMREMPEGWQDTPAAREAYGQIEALIRTDFSEDALWAIKDPRMCLTAPLWIRAAEALGYEVDCLFVVRDPVEVVRSLHARNEWAQGPLYLMWVQYLMEAEAATRHCRRSLITYDELLGDWRATMHKVASELDLTWPDGESVQTARAVDGFLNMGHRHHVAGPQGDGTDAGTGMPALAAKLYRACLSIARGERLWNAISKLQVSYRNVAELYAEHVDLLLKQRWDAEGRAIAAEARVADQQAAAADVAELERLVGDVGLTVAKNHDLLAGKLDAINGSLRGRIDELGCEFEKQKQELLELSHREREQEVANKSRLEAIDARLRAYLDAVGESHADLMDRVRHHLEAADGRLHTRLSVVEESGAKLADQTQQGLEAVDARLKAQLNASEETGARIVGQLQQGLDAVDARLQAYASASERANSDMAVRLQQVDAAHAQLEAGMRALEEVSTTAASRMDRFLDDISTEVRLQLGDFWSALSDKDVRIRHLATELEQRDLSIRQLTGSTSWRITAPLRWLRRAVSPSAWKRWVGRGTKSVYDRLPVPTYRRLALKGIVFRALAPLIRNSRSYRAWRAYEAQRRAGHPAAIRPMPLHAGPVVGEVMSASPVVAETGARQGASADVAAKVLGSLHAAANGVAGEYVSMDDVPADLSQIDVRAIAFYLPQFHPIPENDAWWGRGFTEWTNVSKAVPQFVGHYQPRLPGELGFYDLRLVDVMQRQVELAKHYGLQGFCFHYYWFGGRRLLERPLEQFVANKDIDFPFCICWANENWSRRWDGMDQDVLIGQNHSPEDDIAFITALEPLLRDPRYIRVDGKPLILLYRPSILPDAKATQQRWREHCRQSGIGEIMLAMVQFDVEDPRVFGFDVAIEFPPHKLARGLDPINDKLHIVNPEYSGYVVDYNAVIERAREHSAVDFDMIRGVFPSWDNEARKPGRGYTFANATPGRYREWMDMAIDYARRHPVAGERMVFINAWNEWAEGAHLEPDRRYGYAYLDQTRAALQANPAPRLVAGRRVAIVSHDAHPHGAQYLALNMARELTSGLGMQVDVLLMEGGQLAPAFAETACVHHLAGLAPERLDALLSGLRKSGVELVIANTAVSGRITRAVAAAGLRVVTLVHELPRLIRDYGLEAAVRDLVKHSDKIILPSTAVREGLSKFVDTGLLAARSALRPQGLFTRSRYRGVTDLAEARARLRAKLGLENDARIVLSVGYADRRKGIDLLLAAAAVCCKADPSLHFVWVGHLDETLRDENAAAIARDGLEGHFHFVGLDFDTDDYYAGSDLYALPSREDPFPSVVLESLSVGVPVVAFAGTGGGADLLQRGVGVVVPAFDVDRYAAAILELLADDGERQRLGKAGSELVDAEFSFRAYVMDLLCLGGMDIPRVSVVVPNFNYARYLPERLACIAGQSVPVYEIIVLDDGSSDDSVETIQRLRHSLRPEPRIVVNRVNSGSVFRQWQRGVQLARGEYVWIAEADDLAMPEFLERMLRGMSTDHEVLIGYCQSEAIDEQGRLLMPDYLSYTNDLSTERWACSYLASGAQEVNAALGIKNTIPNVSAVLFRRQALCEVMDRQLGQVLRYKVAGDWLVYLHILQTGKVFYDPQVSNRHRRHGNSVTLGMNAVAHYQEVIELQEYARSMFPMSVRSIAIAEAYRAMLRDQFGLVSEQAVRT